MQKKKPLICCFTGHRPQKLRWLAERGHKKYIMLTKTLYKYLTTLIKSGCKHFICGMALGVDIICAETVLNLKHIYPDIILECALPYPEQDKIWSESDKKIYRKILEKADIVNYISDKFHKDCMLKHNNYMLDKSDLVIAIYNGTTIGFFENKLE